MTRYHKLHLETKAKLAKAIAHLDYSLKKVLILNTDPNKLDEEGLEIWESFAARFARVADLFLVRYVRSYVMMQDPGFEGTFRDFLNQGEKAGLIDDMNFWMGIRALRNMAAHEYKDEDFEAFLIQLKENAPLLIALKDQL